jgi:hypothetical protein
VVCEESSRSITALPVGRGSGAGWLIRSLTNGSSSSRNCASGRSAVARTYRPRRGCAPGALQPQGPLLYLPQRRGRHYARLPPHHTCVIRTRGIGLAHRAYRACARVRPRSGRPGDTLPRLQADTAVPACTGGSKLPCWRQPLPPRRSSSWCRRLVAASPPFAAADCCCCRRTGLFALQARTEPEPDRYCLARYAWRQRQGRSVLRTWC